MIFMQQLSYLHAPTGGGDMRAQITTSAVYWPPGQLSPDHSNDTESLVIRARMLYLPACSTKPAGTTVDKQKEKKEALFVYLW